MTAERHDYIFLMMRHQQLTKLSIAMEHEDKLPILIAEFLVVRTNNGNRRYNGWQPPNWRHEISSCTFISPVLSRRVILVRPLSFCRSMVLLARLGSLSRHSFRCRKDRQTVTERLIHRQMSR